MNNENDLNEEHIHHEDKKFVISHDMLDPNGNPVMVEIDTTEVQQNFNTLRNKYGV